MGRCTFQYKHFCTDLEWFPKRGTETPQDNETSSIIVKYFQSIGGDYENLSTAKTVVQCKGMIKCTNYGIEN